MIKPPQKREWKLKGYTRQTQEMTHIKNIGFNECRDVYHKFIDECPMDDILKSNGIPPAQRVSAIKDLRSMLKGEK